MVIHTAMTEGPTITIEFKTAEGLEAGKTKVRILSHEIGLVEDVVLKADVSGVTATIKLEPEAKPLLREDTRYSGWSVRGWVPVAYRDSGPCFRVPISKWPPARRQRNARRSSDWRNHP